MFIVTFIILYGGALYSIYHYKSIEISDELKGSTEGLHLDFDITNFYNLQDSSAIAENIQKREDIVSLFSKAVEADDITRGRLRKELYDKLYLKFETMQKMVQSYYFLLLQIMMFF